MKQWIGVDLDGTLAIYDTHDPYYIGAPIPRMVRRVKRWLNKGYDVRIFTARVAPSEGRDIEKIRQVIEQWCQQYIGCKLSITCQKDHGLIELWDDRAVAVLFNKAIGFSFAWFSRPKRTL